MTFRQANSAAWKSLGPAARKQIIQGTTFNFGLAAVTGTAMRNSKAGKSQSATRAASPAKAMGSKMRGKKLS